MLRAILNKSWRQHPTRHQLYGHLPPITKTIQVRRTRHAGHCWRSRDELISDVLLWTPTHGRAKAGRPARTYIQQLCEDTGCCPEDLPRAMNDREEWRERVRDIYATSAIWWWWYIYICVCVCVCVCELGLWNKTTARLLRIIPSSECPGYDPNQHRMKFEEYGVPLYCHYSHVYFDQLVFHLWIKQNNLLRIMIISFLTPYSCAQITCMR